jgi:DNA invertase Pin-like site-specific DNA recombinase
MSGNRRWSARYEAYRGVQNPAHQVDALVRAGVAAGDIYVDTASGAKVSRPQLDLVLKLLRAGDTLKITRLAARSCTRSPSAPSSATAASTCT